MAILGHVALGLGTARAYYERAHAGSLPLIMGTSVALATLPDLDLIGRLFGVRQSSDWGHRGLSHSLFAAVLVGVCVGLVSGRWGYPRLLSACFATAAMASHGLVDTLTDGTNGCALLWPFSSERYLAPVRVILRAQLGLSFLGEQGLRFFTRELLLFWPLFLYALYPRYSASRKPTNT